MIHKALIKYGYSNFSLEILEYCDPEIVIEREQYYIDMLMPEYNILKIAGSRMGQKHSDASKLKISVATKGDKHPLFGKIRTEESRAKMSAARKGKNFWLGKTHTEETKAKMRELKKDKSQMLEVLDLGKNERTIYPSIREAARAISCATSAIRYSLNKRGDKPYKGRYIFALLRNPSLE